MATSIASPAASAAPSVPAPPSMSVYDQIGADLSGTGTSTPEPIAEPAAEPVPEPVAEPATEPVAEPVAEPAAETPPEPDQGQDPEPTGEEGLDALLASSRGKRIYAGYKFTRELTKPPELDPVTGQVIGGGVGHLPSIDDVRNYFQSHTDKISMEADFAAGDPASIERFVDYWFGPSNTHGNGASVQAAQLLPQILARNPETHPAYMALANPILDNYRSALWDRFQSETNPDRRQMFYYAAQALEGDVNGQFRNTSQPVSANGNANAGVSDPQLAQERAAFQRERAQFRQERQQASQQVQQQWRAESDTARDKALDALFDEQIKPYFAPTADKFPRQYAAIKHNFRAEIEKDIERNPDAWQLQTVLRQKAERTMNPADRDAAQKHFLNLAVAAITHKKAAFLKEAGAGIMEQSKVNHDALAKTAAKTAPAGSGAPPRQSVKTDLNKQPGETQDAYMRRLIRSDLNG